MSRICVPGLLALLAAVPLTVRAGDKVEAAKPLAPLPEAVVSGAEPYLVIAAVAGG